jgi:hypothetical protein
VGLPARRVPGGAAALGSASDRASQTTDACQAANADGFGCITGTVTASSSGAPLSGVEVAFLGSAGIAPNFTETGADGIYSLVLYDTGGPYNLDIQFVADGYYVGQCWDGDDCSQPTAVPVTGGQTTSGIDAAMVLGGEISGTVTAASDGTPLPGIDVETYDDAGHGYDTTTGSDGTYTLYGVVASGYTVVFEDPNGYYLAQCWDGDNDRCQSSTTVPVTVGQTASGIDAALVPAVSLVQGSPTSADVDEGAGYSGQLTVTNASGGVGYTETSSANSDDVVVDSSGEITAPKTLALGTYTVSGADSDTDGDTGTWTFTLIVSSCGVVVQSAGHAPAVGTAVNIGDRISTGSGSHVEIRFPDNTTLYLAENSTIVCDKFVYDASGNSGRGSDHSIFSIVRGWFTYVSGTIGKRDADQVNIQSQGLVGEIGIRGCVGIVAMRPGGKVLVHVIEGIGFAHPRGKPQFDFPGGEGVLAAGDSYHETASLPPGAASRIPARYRPPSITAVKVEGKAHRHPVLRFRLSERAKLDALVMRGKRRVLEARRTGRAGANKLTFSKALPAGRYAVELVAVHEGLTSIKTATLRIR